MICVRFADPTRDARQIIDVYAPYIEETAITFETEVPSLETFAERIRQIEAQFPYLVLEADGEIIGYAYAHRQAERAAFDWNAELSIYLKEGFVGRGLGRPLYALLEQLLEMQGYVNFYGVITGSNSVSIAMHERMGYRIIGHHVHTGFKFGQWHDTVWLHKRLHDGAPGKIVPVHALDGRQVGRMLAETAEILSQKICQKN